LLSALHAVTAALPRHTTIPLQSKVDALWLALAVMVMPASSYFAIHAAVLNQMLHFWSLLILGCAPLAYLSAVNDGLWWLPMSPRFIKGLSRLLLVLSSLGLLAGERRRCVHALYLQVSDMRR
jgi:hypothetical protein